VYTDRFGVEYESSGAVTMESLNKERMRQKQDSILAIPSKIYKGAKDAWNAQYVVKGYDAAGMTEKGNIDLAKRPVVKNEDGSISTVRSMGINIGGQEILIPTVSPDGKIMSDDEAVAHYKKTKQHLGKFNSPEASDKYAEALHNEQAKMYGGE
jgi:hypothetical protein